MDKQDIILIAILIIAIPMMAVKGVIWQDIVFSLGNIVAVSSEIITIRAKPWQKPRRKVAFIIGGMLAAFCICYASYHLWYSFSVCSLNVVLHIIIGCQRRHDERNRLCDM